MLYTLLSSLTAVGFNISFGDNILERIEKKIVLIN